MHPLDVQAAENAARRRTLKAQEMDLDHLGNVLHEVPCLRDYQGVEERQPLIVSIHPRQLLDK